MNLIVKKQLAKVKRMYHNSNRGDKYMSELNKLGNMSDLCTEEEKKVVSDTMYKLMDEGINRLKSMIIAYKNKSSAPVILVDNNKYDMREYATITQYAQLYGYKSVQAVSNKIARGTIPKSDIVHIPELDVKLIRLP